MNKIRHTNRNNKIIDEVVRLINALSLVYPKISIYLGKREIPELNSSFFAITIFSESNTN